MRKFYNIVLLCLICGFASSVFAKNVVVQNWNCTVNLHQGDTGTLVLSRYGEKVSGGIEVSRGTNTFSHRVYGSWVDADLRITRSLDGNSKQPMSGIVERVGRDKAKIGGRFASYYAGVWSADCDLVSERVVIEEDEDDDPQPTPRPDKPGPSTQTKAFPYKPTTNDNVTFSATASHSDGVKSIAFILDGRVVRRCLASSCEYVSRPLTAGKHIWRVEAISKSGFKNPEYPSELIVKAVSAQGRCEISGHATGSFADNSNIFVVNLYGPNNSSTFRSSAQFRNGKYQFDRLPAGKYTLVVDTRGDLPYGAHPSPTTLTCGNQSKLKRNFDFR